MSDGRPASERAGKGADNEKNQEHNQQKLGGGCRQACQSEEAHIARDQGENEKGQGPTEHNAKSHRSRTQKRRDPARVPVCPQVELRRPDYLGDLLRLRNILAALARPAPRIASQGVSLAMAASRTLVSSLVGGLRGRKSAIKASTSSAMANNEPPAIA